MMQFFIKKNTRVQAKKGFTLIELMVASTIFIFVIVIGLSALVSVNNANKRAQAVRAIMDNLNFAVENISRNVRFGYNYGCITSAVSTFGDTCSMYAPTPVGYPIIGSTGIMFQRFNQTTLMIDVYTYQLKQSATTGYYYIERCIAPLSGIKTCASITAPEINITMLRFSVDGAQSSDGIQPGVSLYVEGIATVKNIQTPFRLQTFMTQRQYEQ